MSAEETGFSEPDGDTAGPIEALPVPETGACAVLCATCLHDGVLDRTMERMVRAEAELAALRTELEHAKAALAGDNEGVRLWMLDCGNLVQKHREHAVEASMRLGAMRERTETAEAKLAAIKAHTPSITDALRHALAYVEHVPNPTSQAAAERYRNALAVISGEETGNG